MSLRRFTKKFTFYYIYIKTISYQNNVLRKITFTFYYIYIKTVDYTETFERNIKFTFYYIYIKTSTTRNGYCCKKIYILLYLY